MATKTVYFTVNLAKSANASSVKLSNVAATYGVKRVDNDVVIVAAGVDLVNDSGGNWHYTFTEPGSPPLVYAYVIKSIIGGQTFYLPRIIGDDDTDPGVTNVRDGVEYVINGDLLEGTLDVGGPITGNHGKFAAPVVITGNHGTFAGVP